MNQLHIIIIIIFFLSLYILPVSSIIKTSSIYLIWIMLVFCIDSHQIKVSKISKSLTIIQDALKQKKKIKINESSQHFFKHKLWLYLCKYLYILIYIRFLKLSQCDLCVCIYLYTSISTWIQFFKLSQSASYIFLFRFKTFLQKRICKNISRSSQMMRHKM